MRFLDSQKRKKFHSFLSKDQLPFPSKPWRKGKYGTWKAQMRKEKENENGV